MSVAVFDAAQLDFGDLDWVQLPCFVIEIAYDIESDLEFIQFLGDQMHRSVCICVVGSHGSVKLVKLG